MDAKEMLEIGKKNGLKTVRECYNNIIMQYNIFFSSDNYNSEINDFENDIDKYDLELSDTIEEAFSKIANIGLEWNDIEDSQNKNLLGC